MGPDPTLPGRPTTMSSYVEAFTSFLLPYCKSDEERAHLTDENHNEHFFANLTAADDEAEGNQRLAQWRTAVRLALNGESRSARRVAELCELGDDAVCARPWWRYAAALGNGDAQAYVEHVLKESAPAAAAEVADASGAADDVGER